MAAKKQPVPGHPNLFYEGAALQPGQQQLNATLLDRLQYLASRTGKYLFIESGYRTPAYSASHGGFSTDPHTRHIAADVVTQDGTPIGNVYSVAELGAAGLRSGNVPNFYKGQPDPEHVDLVGVSGQPTSSKLTLEQLWIAAGGPKSAAPIMAAIATAESGGTIDAQHKNADGSIDRGLWQINSSHTQYNAQQLLSNPLYNAKAAVAIFNSQGLGAWTTYKNGAYKKFVGKAAAPHTSSGGGIFGSITGIPGDVAGAVGGVAHDVASPFEAVGKFFAWISDGKNIKRVGMVILGGLMVLLGLKMLADQSGATGAVQSGATSAAMLAAK